MPRKKWHVVIVGTRPGIYNNWSEAGPKVLGIPGAIYESYTTAALAHSVFSKARREGAVKTVKMEATSSDDDEDDDEGPPTHPAHRRALSQDHQQPTSESAPLPANRHRTASPSRAPSASATPGPSRSRRPATDNSAPSSSRRHHPSRQAASASAPVRSPAVKQEESDGEVVDISHLMGRASSAHRPATPDLSHNSSSNQVQSQARAQPAPLTNHPSVAEGSLPGPGQSGRQQFMQSVSTPRREVLNRESHAKARHSGNVSRHARPPKAKRKDTEREDVVDIGYAIGATSSPESIIPYISRDPTTSRVSTGSSPDTEVTTYEQGEQPRSESVASSRSSSVSPPPSDVTQHKHPPVTSRASRKLKECTAQQTRSPPVSPPVTDVTQKEHPPASVGPAGKRKTAPEPSQSPVSLRTLVTQDDYPPPHVRPSRSTRAESAHPMSEATPTKKNPNQIKGKGKERAIDVESVIVVSDSSENSDELEYLSAQDDNPPPSIMPVWLRPDFQTRAFPTHRKAPSQDGEYCQCHAAKCATCHRPVQTPTEVYRTVGVSAVAQNKVSPVVDPAESLPSPSPSPQRVPLPLSPPATSSHPAGPAPFMSPFSTSTVSTARRAPLPLSPPSASTTSRARYAPLPLSPAGSTPATSSLAARNVPPPPPVLAVSPISRQARPHGSALYPSLEDLTLSPTGLGLFGFSQPVQAAGIVYEPGMDPRSPIARTTSVPLHDGRSPVFGRPTPPMPGRGFFG